MNESENVRRNLRFDYAGSTVLVTGASQGIGYAIASAFVMAGAEVHITGTRADPNKYRGDLSAFTYHRCCLEQQEHRAALSDVIPKLDILVNNAGTTREDEYETEGFAALLEVNLTAQADLCYRFRDRLSQSQGAIINLGSVGSYIGLRDHPAYTAAKHALTGFTKSLADKWAPYNIRVNSVAPGFVDTRMIDWARSAPEDRKRFLRQIPAARFGQPEDIANAVLFLASFEADYLRGVSLPVDGGYLLR